MGNNLLMKSIIFFGFVAVLSTFYESKVDADLGLTIYRVSLGTTLYLIGVFIYLNTVRKIIGSDSEGPVAIAFITFYAAVLCYIFGYDSFARYGVGIGLVALGIDAFMGIYGNE